MGLWAVTSLLLAKNHLVFGSQTALEAAGSAPFNPASPVSRRVWVAWCISGCQETDAVLERSRQGQGRGHQPVCIGPVSFLSVYISGVHRVHLQSMWKPSTLSLGGVNYSLRAVPCGGCGPAGLGLPHVPSSPAPEEPDCCLQSRTPILAVSPTPLAS